MAPRVTCGRTADSSATLGSIEIAPGEHRTLLGAAASWKSIQDDTYVACRCILCDIDVFTVPEAAYVLCPSCRTVVPTEDQHAKDDTIVCLGFTPRDLESWWQAY